jgi:hypothetical protein
MLVEQQKNNGEHARSCQLAQSEDQQ